VSELQTIAYEPSRLEGVLRLFDRVYGEAPSPEEFEWWFDGNPVGPRSVFLAGDGGHVAGVLGASFYRAVVAGRETLAALPLWAVTDPDYRGRGIFQRLNAAVERAARDAGASVELGFTNRMAGPIYVSKLGWSDVHRLRIWARPLVRVRRSPDGADRFGEHEERAYRALAPRLRSHFVRDAAYLNWRYTDSTRPYTLLRSANGYAVVGRKQVRGLNAAFVADLVAPTLRETRALLRMCARAAHGARALLALLPAVHARAYLAAGFVPTPETIRLIGHALDGPLPVGPRAWHFTLGDTDYF
jgi:GNAT superfamily N-acetyltransferase